jgi:hypothetical protein
MHDTLNLIEVSNNIVEADNALDKTYHTLVLLMERGHFIEVTTIYGPDSKKWISTYHWMWLKTNGLGHKWIQGDPVGTNGKPWIIKNPDLYTVDNTTLQVTAHRQAVANLLILKDASLYEPAMYMSKPIPNLFDMAVHPDILHDPILKMEDERRKKRLEEHRAKQPKQHDPMQEIMDMVNSGQLKSIEMTNDDFKAIIEGKNIKSHNYIPQTDNYALGA